MERPQSDRVDVTTSREGVFVVVVKWARVASETRAAVCVTIAFDDETNG